MMREYVNLCTDMRNALNLISIMLRSKNIVLVVNSTIFWIFFTFFLIYGGGETYFWDNPRVWLFEGKRSTLSMTSKLSELVKLVDKIWYKVMYSLVS